MVPKLSWLDLKGLTARFVRRVGGLCVKYHGRQVNVAGRSTCPQFVALLVEERGAGGRCARGKLHD